MVTKQTMLAGSEYRFHAFNGRNDLGNIFLARTQVPESQGLLPNPRELPYLPTEQPPWRRQHH